MFFKTNDFNPDGVTLHATNTDLDGRWKIFSTKQMTEATGDNWKWFNSIRNLRATRLNLAYDDIVGRPVIAKTIQYRPDDLQSPQTVAIRRMVLLEQIRILNDISSPLLPEPLDWFHTTNTVDGLDLTLQKTEPVLILDYLPGIPLATTIRKKGIRFRSEKEQVDTPRVARIAIKLLHFLRILDSYGYGYLDLNPEHILLLKNDIPRFVGIGSICPTTEEGTLDSEHINFWTSSRGYAAPELLDASDNWAKAKAATPSQVGSFSLGVVLHQMFTESITIDRAMLCKGSFVYPNGISEQIVAKRAKGSAIDKLIRELCEHDPAKRLTDFDEIEKKLRIIDGSLSNGRSSTAQRLLIKQQREDAIKKQRERDVFRRQQREVEAKKERQRLEIQRLEERRLQELNRKREEEINRKRVEELKKRTVEPKKKSEWCFLSTAAYGSPTEQKLDTLRWFRDNILRKRKWGRHLLTYYAKKSPEIADRLQDMPLRKKSVRFVIDIAVKAVEQVKRHSQTPTLERIWIFASTGIYYLSYCMAVVFVWPARLGRNKVRTN